LKAHSNNKADCAESPNNTITLKYKDIFYNEVAVHPKFRIIILETEKNHIYTEFLKNYVLRHFKKYFRLFS